MAFPRRLGGFSSWHVHTSMPEQANAAQDTTDPVPDAAPQLASTYMAHGCQTRFCTSIKLQVVPLVVVWSPGAASRSSPCYRNYAQMHYTGQNPTLRLAETHSNNRSSAGIVQEKVRMMYVNMPSQWSGC